MGTDQIEVGPWQNTSTAKAANPRGGRRNDRHRDADDHLADRSGVQSLARWLHGKPWGETHPEGCEADSGPQIAPQHRHADKHPRPEAIPPSSSSATAHPFPVSIRIPKDQPTVVGFVREREDGGFERSKTTSSCNPLISLTNLRLCFLSFRCNASSSSQ